MNIDQISITVANKQILDELAEAIEWYAETMQRGNATISGSVAYKKVDGIDEILKQQSRAHPRHTLIFTYTPEKFNWRKTYMALLKDGMCIEENEITTPEAKPEEAPDEPEPDFTAAELKMVYDALSLSEDEIIRITRGENVHYSLLKPNMSRKYTEVKDKALKLLADKIDIDLDDIDLDNIYFGDIDDDIDDDLPF